LFGRCSPMPNGFRLAHSDGCQRFVIPSRDLFGEELLRRKALVRTARPPSDRDPAPVRIVRVLQLVLRDDPAHLLRRVAAFFVAVGRDEVRRARSIAHRVGQVAVRGYVSRMGCWPSLGARAL
jgi:hypothetical protein